MKKLLRFGAAAALYGAWMALESRAPLRRPTQPRPRRVARNLTIGILGSSILRVAFYPALLKLASWTTRRKIGLLGGLARGPFRLALSFLALDCTLYIWHRMNHQMEFFWRFHNPHHVDLDMDVSTGSRFHFGELAFSAAPRAIEILLFGIPASAMVVYDTVSMAAVHFHHSNVRFPERIERALNAVIVTPRMHGIHHSIVEGETDSNFSTVLSIWDRLAGSFKTGIPQSNITIGVPSYRDPSELTIGKILAMPWQGAREWRLPDGRVPTRGNAASALTGLNSSDRRKR